MSLAFSSSGDCPARDKQRLRQELLARRRALKPSQAAALSERIQQTILDTSIWREATCVALYIAVRNEVSTEQLLNAAWHSGKQVLLPRCLPPEQGEGLMEFAPCHDRNALVTGFFGLLEPCRKRCPGLPLTPSTDGTSLFPTLILVPAVGISPSGGRLGYGKGFYDRLLSRPHWGGIRRIAPIYAFQLVSFPSSTLDVPMHGYVTEKEYVWL